MVPSLPAVRAKLGRKPRITVVDDDEELIGLVARIFNATHSVRSVAPPYSLMEIADQKPHVVIVGLLAAGSAGSLTAWDVVTLVRRHRDLHAVPVVLLTIDVVTIMTDPEKMRVAYRDLHLIGMPFDLDLICRVVNSLAHGRPPPQSSATARSSAAATAPDEVGTEFPADDRLPRVCAHGYDDAGGSSTECYQCS